ncbi:optic atrophy 3 protein homolog isoform X2 [Eurytemora carolleeae]|uniref:optic atrophy 3 protein homolog isoform X2 n=1 Tax=Eurytemora carolleeae TaxID=1294199 RepID=UPI000C77A25E|nr:optic atrophy 3 protein homolog isoform X2 [Eurytemora carolleeae]|eukprot:XP_023334297.1 optic atrophy 3 protein homolog isoform X2 [Eurytemora affinis]
MSGHGGQPFPLSKLAFMYVKKVAQPIASRIARKAEKDNWFKTYICLPPANLYHFYEAKIKFKVMNIGRTRISKVPKLNEKAAIELGSNLCAEFIIMSVASILALHEVRKYKAREIEVEERLNKETKDLRENIESLNRIIQTQNQDIETLSNLIYRYRNQYSHAGDIEEDSTRTHGS